MSELDANIIVDGQKVIATSAQSGTVIKDGGVIDATAIIQTDNGPQKVVKTYDINGGGGGGSDSVIKDYEAPSYTVNTTLFASPLPIPNLDALTEAGTYRVHFDMEIEGTTSTVTYIADVSPIKVSGMLLGHMQNLYVGPGGGDSVSIIRSGILNGGAITWADWAGNSLVEKQNKTLSSAITVGGASQTTVEGALGAINTAKLENKASLKNSSLFITDGNFSASGVCAIIVNQTAFTNSNQSYCVAIGCSSAPSNYAVNVGYYSFTQPSSIALGMRAISNSQYGISIGCSTSYSSWDGSNVGSDSTKSIAIGTGAVISSNTPNSIQFGEGTNSTANTFQVYSYPMLDGTTGLIPAARLGTGFDATKTQVLKNIQGVLTWVDEA